MLAGFLLPITSSYLEASTESFSIVAKVNNDVITSYDIAQRKKINSLLNKTPTKTNSAITETLIEEKIKNQYMVSLGISLSPEEEVIEIDKFLKSFKIGKKVLDQALNRNNISWAVFETYLMEKARWKKTILMLFRNKIKSSENFTSPSYTEYLFYAESKMDVSEIIIPFSERGKKNATLLANRLHLELNSGASFEIAAKRFSRAKSADSGGRIGLIDDTKLPPKVKLTLSSMKSNEVSKPITIGESIVLFKLNTKIELEKTSISDPVVQFVIVTSKEVNGVSECNNDKKYPMQIGQLSKLDKNHAKILSLATIFEPTFLSDERWLILCKRELDLDSQTIAKLKNRYLNSKIKEFSSKLLLELHREAIIQ